MRKVTIADFGRDESQKYARLQSLLESVWSAHHEARIVQHHARVSVSTPWLGDDRFREAGLVSATVGQSRFSERLDMSHYQHPLRKPSVAHYVAPVGWRYFPASWAYQYKMMSLDEDEWSEMSDVLSSYLPTSSLRKRQLQSLCSFVERVLALVKWCVSAICNRARFQGA
ncbi:hypothetical protein [Candidatus Similichlamydia laticola]|uniref:Uncharacterized protein n=1 Tax=Candidatus Similichlamydia laticola TaxID=2170265 RepID=A0A369KE65_9BACT|nr:hypothetical protein [Candidatus Similichlamydia laticola]RDB31750.1 hypothetical protein HAT2_00130 [Candidatus Similichlamydia laticola]